MNTTYETEPTTFAAAWASSPLGEPVRESTEPWDRGTEPATPTSVARHAVIAAALACGIGLGAALGLTVFDSTLEPVDTTQPAVMVPQMEAPAGGPPVPGQVSRASPCPDSGTPAAAETDCRRPRKRTGGRGSAHARRAGATRS